MIARLPRAALWGTAVALYLRFGLEPTGWLFYGLSQSLGVAALHWGYTVFRGAGYVFGLWSLQNPACIAAGLLVALLVAWRSSRRDTA